jgi:hypothetical protein
MVQCEFVIRADPRRGDEEKKAPHQCRNRALLGERHCRDHASEEEIERRNSLSDADVRRVRGGGSSTASAPSSLPSLASPPSPLRLPAQRTKPSAPTSPLSRSNSSSSSSPSLPRSPPRDLPPELEALVLAHLDIDDLEVARRDPEQLPPGMRRALDRKIRECEAPGLCAATYRALFSGYYRDELRR